MTDDRLRELYQHALASRSAATRGECPAPERLQALARREGSEEERLRFDLRGAGERAQVRRHVLEEQRFRPRFGVRREVCAVRIVLDADRVHDLPAGERFCHGETF